MSEMMEVEQLLQELRRVTNATFSLIDKLNEARGQDEEWKRFPRAKTRCGVSGWSRSTLLRHIDSGNVRSKHIGTSRFYSATDVRRLLETSNEAKA